VIIFILGLFYFFYWIFFVYKDEIKKFFFFFFVVRWLLWLQVASDGYRRSTR